MENWDDLRYFVAVARAGALTSAAETLGVSVSTVFRRVGALEEALGTRLFDRRRSGVLLTPAGETLLALVTDIEARVLEASRRLSGADLVPEGTVRLTAPPDLATTVLASTLVGFRDAYPKIVLELNSTGARLDLSAREADVAIRAGSPPSEPDLVARKVADVGIAVYASRAYLEARGRPRTWADLADHDLLLASGWFAGLRAVRFFESHAGRPPRFRCSSFGEMKQFVRLGFGVAALPCMLVRDQPEIVQVFDPMPEPVGGLWILVHRDVRRIARIRAFLDYARESLTRLVPVIEGRDAVRA